MKQFYWDRFWTGRSAVCWSCSLTNWAGCCQSRPAPATVAYCSFPAGVSCLNEQDIPYSATNIPPFIQYLTDVLPVDVDHSWANVASEELLEPWPSSTPITPLLPDATMQRSLAHRRGPRPEHRPDGKALPIVNAASGESREDLAAPPGGAHWCPRGTLMTATSSILVFLLLRFCWPQCPWATGDHGTKTAAVRRNEGQIKILSLKLF